MRRALALILLLAARPASGEPRCVIEAAPAAVPTKAGKPACHRPSATMAKDVRKAIEGQFQPTHDGGKADIAFGCDGLGKTIREITIETGSGHGGSLELYRARRAPDGAYDVRVISYNGGAPPFKLFTGSARAPNLDFIRAALSATVKEVWPPPPPNTIGGISGSSSSNDFHVLVRLTDDDGRVLERQFTGYQSDQDQATYLGIQAASFAMLPILSIAQAPTSTTTVTDDDRALFAERFAASVPHFDDPFYWWVMERYVDLARSLGTRATIAGLLTRMVVTKDDRSKVDARKNAIDALAKITGWDARTKTSTDAEVGKRYLAECKR